MNKILTSMIVLLISQTACLQTAPTAPTAPTAGSARLHTPGDTPEPPKSDLLSKSENAAGAVYELPTPAPLCAIVTADEALHLRAGPGEKAEHITYLLSGQQVRVSSPAGRWWKVTTSAGQTGYANSRYLQERKCQP